ncbi:MAG: hypothetical protein DME57_05045 [Verrucomicrobia bacterium]|nr:MAG: hypothetical protein DME57_05045 [Verrucomicrobiota bacterium]
MKFARAEKNEEGLIFSHGGRVCTVRRSHRIGRSERAGADIVTKSRPLPQRVLLSLLPHFRCSAMI